MPTIHTDLFFTQFYQSELIRLKTELKKMVPSLEMVTKFKSNLFFTFWMPASHTAFLIT